MALGLAGEGRIECCDLSEEWTAVARRYWEEAGVDALIRLHLAPAAETLQAMLARGEAGRFDMAFVDADKANYTVYYEQCLQLLRPGGLILFDNTLWGGSVADPDNRSEDTEAIRALNRTLFEDLRVDISLVPIGDGLTLARKHDDLT
jgi:predicted O-methyltransferase YrrM